jgi:hypothetical protein
LRIDAGQRRIIGPVGVTAAGEPVLRLPIGRREAGRIDGAGGRVCRGRRRRRRDTVPARRSGGEQRRAEAGAQGGALWSAPGGGGGAV